MKKLNFLIIIYLINLFLLSCEKTNQINNNNKGITSNLSYEEILINYEIEIYKNIKKSKNFSINNNIKSINYYIDIFLLPSENINYKYIKQYFPTNYYPNFIYNHKLISFPKCLKTYSFKEIINYIVHYRIYDNIDYHLFMNKYIHMNKKYYIYIIVYNKIYELNKPDYYAIIDGLNSFILKYKYVNIIYENKF